MDGMVDSVLDFVPSMRNEPLVSQPRFDAKRLSDHGKVVFDFFLNFIKLNVHLLESVFDVRKIFLRGLDGFHIYRLFGFVKLSQLVFGGFLPLIILLDKSRLEVFRLLELDQGVVDLFDVDSKSGGGECENSHSYLLL